MSMSKKRIYQNKKGKESAQYVLHYSLLNLLKLIAPIMPFITEEIWSAFNKKKLLLIESWPD